MIWVLSGTIFVLSSIKGFSMYGQAVTMARVGNRIVADYQKLVYETLIAQGVSYFDERHSTESMVGLTIGATSARAILDLIINSFGRDFTSLIGLIIVMYLQDPAVTALGFIVLPAAIIGVRKLIRSARRIMERELEGYSQIIQSMQETAQGIRIVKSYTLEDRLRVRMAENIDSFERAVNRLTIVTSRSSPLMETLGGFAIGLAVLYSGHTMLSSGKTPGEFATLLAAFIFCYEPAKRIARLNIDLATNLVGARTLFSIIDSVPAERDDAALPPLAVKQGCVEFRDVAFAYRPGESVLRGISFVLEPGCTTALVGPSGGGKSTIMSLMERFYEPQVGVISFDDQLIALHSRRSLRAAISYVSQDVFLFTGTMRDNIAFGKPDASEMEIVAAAKAANAHDFIMTFERGYDTPVGEQGLQVSGGQRARIAIARAFLKNAPILLLDEPTAALDSESEREIQRALDKLRASRTTLVIAHRLQTVAAADKICVVEHGRIVETGRHDELIARRGRYYDVFKAQFQTPQSAST
jgi:ATP-binding cassette subfamily B protein